MDSNRAQWFGILDGLINIGPAQLAGKFKETSLIGGGMIAQTARECHHPRIPLNGENIPGALHLQWPWIDAHGLPVARSIVWTLIDAGRIADVDLDERFFNGRIIQCSQPGGCLRTTAACIDDEIGMQIFLVLHIVAPAAHAHPSDTGTMIGTAVEAKYLAVVENTDVGPGRDTATDMVLKQWTTLAMHTQRPRELEFPVPKVKPAEVFRRTDQQGSILFKRGREIRKEFPNDICSSTHQEMDMPSLGNAFACFRIRGKLISFDNRYQFKIVRKYTSSQEPGHAGPDDQGMLPIGTLL